MNYNVVILAVLLADFRRSTLESTHQKDMFKDLCRAVHLAQNDDHLIVNELLEFPQVACHVHLQLCSDLRDTCTRETRRHGSL